MPRWLTFLEEPSSSNTGFVVGFCILAGLSAISLIQAVLETRRDLYGKHTLKYLLRWVSIALIIENATLAVLEARTSINATWGDVVYVIHATLAPSLLLSTFDVTYMVHKVRCIPFCGGIHVEMSSTTRIIKHSPAVFLKLCLRFIAVLLLVLGILMNFGVLFEEDFSLAGRVGWVYLVQKGSSLSPHEKLQICLALLPMGVVTLCCLYFSLALWRYGTTFSMVVYSSPVNPWFTPFFGTMALAATQWFGKRWFSILSHVGIFVFLETILLLLIQVNRDLHSETELALFLSTVAKVPVADAKRSKGRSNNSATSNIQQDAAAAVGDSKENGSTIQEDEQKDEENNVHIKSSSVEREEKEEPISQFNDNDPDKMNVDFVEEEKREETDELEA